MIPKIIHYCWLSDDPYPQSIQRCIDTWHAVLPDYSLRLWTLRDFPRDRFPWIHEAFDTRKYAFAADFVRNYALYHEGGIYLDSDVEVLRTFDPLLHLPYFIGNENGSGFIEPAIMGAEAGNLIFKKMLDYYTGRHFIKADGSLDTRPLPKIMSEVVKESYDYVEIPDHEHFDYNPQHLSVLPYWYFSPVHRVFETIDSTDRTIAIHRYASSWVPWYRKLKIYAKALLGKKVTRWIILAKRKIKGPSHKKG